MTPRNDTPPEPMVARDATYHRAPAGLRSRVMAAIAREEPAREAPRAARIFGFAAAFATVAALSWFAALRFAVPPVDPVAGQVLAAHVRSLLAENHLNDVASSDRHTVKPWFAGKIDYAPPVQDLASAGFPLLGGRLDYVNQRPVAALTYRYRQHVVNLFVWPAAGQAPAEPVSLQGYSLLAWRRGGMQYWAVTDAGPEQLAALAAALH